MKRWLILAATLVLLVVIGVVVVPRVMSPAYREAFPLIPGVEYGMSPKAAAALLGPGTVIEAQVSETDNYRRYEERDIQVMGKDAAVTFDYLRVGFRYVLQAIRITVDIPGSAAAETFGMSAVDRLSAAIPGKALQVSDRVDAANDRRVISVSWQRGSTGTDTSVAISEKQVLIHGSTNEFQR